MQNSLEPPASVLAERKRFSPWWQLGCWCRDAIRAFLAALRFLTVLPSLMTRPVTTEDLGRAVGYFPCVGVIIGGILLGVDRLGMLLWPTGVTTALVLASWVLLTGALHLDGWLDSCDGILGGHTPEDRLRIMRDERVGAFAVIGGVLLLLLKFQALAAITDRRNALLLAPALGRWAMVLGIVLFPYARPAGLGRAMKDSSGWRQAALASASAAVIAWCSAGWIGVLALALAGAGCVLIARFVLTRLPGLTGDTYGAVCELVEVEVLLIMLAGEQG
jgi:adenosylcobinamide-GDP ribazoletransferase